MNYKTIGTVYGKDMSVFPYNIYSSKVTLPRPYYNYEPKGPGTYLVPPGTNVPSYNHEGVFGWTYYPNGYGEGNLIGHTCDCECATLPSGLGKTTSCTRCWCGEGTVPKNCTAIDVKKIRLR